MAAPILGAVVGLLLMSRMGAERQNRSMLDGPDHAAAAPRHRRGTTAAGRVGGLVHLRGAAGLHAAAAGHLHPARARRLRGRVFGLAGALSVAATGAFYLLAGWISQHTRPAAAVGVCAVVSLGGLVLLAARWPRGEIAGGRADLQPTGGHPGQPECGRVRDATGRGGGRLRGMRPRPGRTGAT